MAERDHITRHDDGSVTVNISGLPTFCSARGCDELIQPGEAVTVWLPFEERTGIEDQLLDVKLAELGVPPITGAWVQMHRECAERSGLKVKP